MEEKPLQGVIGSLLTARNDAKKQTATFSLGMKGTFQVVSLGGKGFVLGSEGISCVDHAVDLIASDQVLGEHFSRVFISNKINGLIQTLLDVNDQDLQAKTAENVRRLVQELEKTAIVQWNIMIPIANLTLKIPPFQIGRVSFALMDKQLTDETLLAIKEINERTISPEEVKRKGMKMIVELVQSGYVNKSVATVTVEAADQDSAVEHAEEEIEHALNALRFYGRAVLQNDGRRYRIFIGAEGTIFSSKHTTICLMPKQQFTLPFRHTGYFFPYEIDTKTIALIQKLWLAELSGVLQKHDKKRTEFEKLLVTAIDFFGIAMNQLNPREAYLSFVTSLESLLLKENEPRGLLAERVAIIVGETYKAREELFKQMEHIYYIRSRIVHNGFTDITEDDVGLVSIIAFQAILHLVSLSDKINDIGRLVQACSKSKFSGPPFNPES